MRKLMMFTALSLAVLATACGKKDAVDPCVGDACTEPPPPPPPPPPPSSGVATLAMAGNVTNVSSANAGMTANLIAQMDSSTIVIPLGDNAAPDGSLSAYQSVYQPTWGRFLSRTRAVLGNREYEASTTADGHFSYFGDKAGPVGQGWYAFDAGAWRVIVLNVHDNANTANGNGYGAASAQFSWLNTELNAMLSANRKCVMVVYHSGRYLSSNDPAFLSRGAQINLWTSFYGGGVDLVVNGGEHRYERFAPMDPNGTADANGVTQITAGSGGNSVQDASVRHPNSAILIPQFGVLKLTLRDGSADYQFVNASAGGTTDQGTITCR